MVVFLSLRLILILISGILFPKVNLGWNQHKPDVLVLKTNHNRVGTRKRSSKIIRLQSSLCRVAIESMSGCNRVYVGLQSSLCRVVIGSMSGCNRVYVGLQSGLCRVAIGSMSGCNRVYVGLQSSLCRVAIESMLGCNRVYVGLQSSLCWVAIGKMETKAWNKSWLINNFQPRVIFNGPTKLVTGIKRHYH
jgi:hypothetical protein